MEIRASSRLNQARCKGCTNASSIWGRSWGCRDSKNVTVQLVQSTLTPARACKNLCLLQRGITPSMEIRANSRLNLARCKGCTNASSIWGRCWGYRESNNVAVQLVQSTHKPARYCKHLRLLQRRIMPSVEIRANSRLNLAQCKGCIKASSKWGRSWVYRQSENVTVQLVQSTHKSARARKCLRLLQRRIKLSMEIRATSRLNLARCKGCTNASSIWGRSWVYREYKNATFQSVQSTHKPKRTCLHLRRLQRRVMPSMEIRANSRLNLARCNGWTNARSIWGRSWGYRESINATVQLVRWTHKPARACKHLPLLQHRVMPSMEIRANSRLNLAWCKGCTKASSIWGRSWVYRESKIVTVQLVQSTHKPARACKHLRLLQCRVMPSMEICANSRLKLARCKGCTNASGIWGRSWVYREYKNATVQSVQSTHKPKRACLHLRRLQRRVMPSMEIRANSRLNLARCNGWTNARSIWGRSWGYRESINATVQLVRWTHKPARACKHLPLLQHRVMPSMEIRANSRLNLAWCKGCTKASSIWGRSWVYRESKIVTVQLVQSTHKPARACKHLRLLQRRVMPSMEIRATSRLNLARCKGCTNASSIWGRIWGYSESKNVTVQLVQSTHKSARARKRLRLLQRRIKLSMEIRATSRLNLAQCKGCTNASSIWGRSWGYSESKNVSVQLVQSTHKPARTCKHLRLLQCGIMPSIEIRANSRLNLARWKGCTNASSIWGRSWVYREYKNATFQSVQSTHKPKRTCLHLRRLQRRVMPSMEIRANSRLNLARCNGWTNARSIWGRSWGYRESINATVQLVRWTHKPARACKHLPLLQHRVMPSMEIRANSRLNLAWCKGCTKASSIWGRSWVYRESKIVTVQLVQSTHKPARACKHLRLLQCRVMPSMEICANSRLKLARCKGCTNASGIWGRSWVYREYKNATVQSVQSTHKPKRACLHLRRLQRRVMPSMEIRANSRLNLARCNGWTNARSIWGRSWGYRESINATVQLVRWTHKPARACKHLPLLQHRVMPSMEIRANSRLNLAWCKGCTKASSIWGRSWVYRESKIVTVQLVQSTHKPARACKHLRLLQRRVMPSMEIRATSRLNLARCKGCTNANSIWGRSWGYKESKNETVQLVQSMHKPALACKHLRLLQRRECRVNGNSRKFTAKGSPVQRLH